MSGLFCHPIINRQHDLAKVVMTEISNALPVTPVTPVTQARIFAEHPDAPMTDDEIVEGIDGYRGSWSERVWLLREKRAWRSGVPRAASWSCAISFSPRNADAPISSKEAAFRSSKKRGSGARAKHSCAITTPTR
jgi:hypothetical protein